MRVSHDYLEPGALSLLEGLIIVMIAQESDHSVPVWLKLVIVRIVACSFLRQLQCSSYQSCLIDQECQN